MSLDQIVSAIVDDKDASPYLRAIRLFELQVAIFYPRSFRALTAATNAARGPNKKLRTARIYAGMKFLEQIETELRQIQRVDAISISSLAKDPRYQEIFDNVIAANGGWMRIRHSISAEDFDGELSKQRDLADAAAKIVDFSFRFGEMPSRGSYTGGVTTARYVVVNAKSYQFTGEISTIKNRWRKSETSERTVRLGGYGQNSLCNGSANFSQRIRDFGSTSSEFAAAGKSPVVLCFSGLSPRDGRDRRRPPRMPGYGKTPVVATRLNLKNRSDDL